MTEDKVREAVSVLQEGGWADEPVIRLDVEGNEVKVETQGACGECKWWIEQGPRTKDIDFELTLVGWCKRMPRTEMDKDKDDWCGEFQPR